MYVREKQKNEIWKGKQEINHESPCFVPLREREPLRFVRSHNQMYVFTGDCGMVDWYSLNTLPISLLSYAEDFVETGTHPLRKNQRLFQLVLTAQFSGREQEML